jgi:hypothetical protein
VPSEWIAAVLDACAAAPQWNFLFLSKFPLRMSQFTFPPNSWVGTTVDKQARVKNAERAFRKIKAPVKWLACEPLLEPLTFSDLSIFNWLVIGGASETKAAPRDPVTGPGPPTPDFQPPYRWVRELEVAMWQAGGRVYEKANLYSPYAGRLELVAEYPIHWRKLDAEEVEAKAEAEQAPAELRYQPRVEHK